MPYLSRLILNPACHRVLADLLSPYEMHRTLSRALPTAEPGERLLFRVDQESSLNRPQVLVQSRRPLSWDFLEETPDYLYHAPELTLCNPAQKAFVLACEPGQDLSFRLRANPTFKRGRRRLAWLRRPEQLAWLHRQGQAGGFVPQRVILVQEQMVWCRKRQGEASCSMCFCSVLYSGSLRITDPDALIRTVEQGLGSGKAFGFGLLSLASGP